MEALRAYLCTVQENEGWNGSFVINPMHVGSNVVNQPKHLLIVGPFMDEDMEMGQRMSEEIQCHGQSPHLYLYNRL
jgi:hypothetical protein